MDGDLPCAVAGTDGADHCCSWDALSLCTVPACGAVALGQSGRSERDGTMAGWLDGFLVLRRQSRVLQRGLRRARDRDADADVVLSLGFCRPVWCRVECRTGAPDGSGYDGRTGAAGWPPRRGCGRYGCSAGMILTSLSRRPTVCSRLYIVTSLGRREIKTVHIVSLALLKCTTPKPAAGSVLHPRSRRIS